jgi:hypothetical protein
MQATPMARLIVDVQHIKSLPMQFPFVTLTLIWFILATCVCSAAEKTGDLNIQVDFATGIGISPPTRAVL